MTKSTKLIIALIAAIGMIGIVTAWANTIYLPLIEKQPTYTPTATFTATSTVSPTPTRTPTPTPGVKIVDIDYDPPNALDEYIELKNTSSKSVDMDGWWIKADSGPRYDFVNFTLGGGASVKVWTKNGSDTSTNLYWDRTEPVWNDNGDTAYLRDSDGKVIDTYQY